MKYCQKMRSVKLQELIQKPSEEDTLQCYQYYYLKKKNNTIERKIKTEEEKYRKQKWEKEKYIK